MLESFTTTPVVFISLLFFVALALVAIWQAASVKQYKRKYKSSNGKNRKADELATLLHKRIK